MDKTSGKTPADRLRSIKKKGRKDFEALSSLADKKYYIDRLAKFVDELMEQIDDERRENKYEDEGAIESDGEQSDEQFNPSGSDTEEVRAEQLELKESEDCTTPKSKLRAEVPCSESSKIIEATAPIAEVTAEVTAEVPCGGQKTKSRARTNESREETMGMTWNSISKKGKK